jgi:hypothetical protein
MPCGITGLERVKEIGQENVQRITLVQDSDQLRSIVNKVQELPVHLDSKNLSTDCTVACLPAQTPSCDLPQYEAKVQPSYGDLR